MIFLSSIQYIHIYVQRFVYMILFDCFLESKFYPLYSQFIKIAIFIQKGLGFLIRGTVKVFLHVSFIEFVVLFILNWSENN